MATKQELEKRIDQLERELKVEKDVNGRLYERMVTLEREVGETREALRSASSRLIFAETQATGLLKVAQELAEFVK